jgi:hypothetical protein
LDRQNWTGRTGYAELDKLRRQGYQDKIVRAGQPGGQREKDSQNRSARTGQPEKDRQNHTSMTELPRQEGKDRAARRGLPAQDC